MALQVELARVSDVLAVLEPEAFEKTLHEEPDEVEIEQSPHVDENT